jgi:hypothetical protein
MGQHHLHGFQHLSFFKTDSTFFFVSLGNKKGRPQYLTISTTGAASFEHIGDNTMRYFVAWGTNPSDVVITITPPKGDSVNLRSPRPIGVVPPGDAPTTTKTNNVELDVIIVLDPRAINILDRIRSPLKFLQGSVGHGNRPPGH